MATYTTLRILTVAVLAVALGAPAQPSTATTELPAPIFAGEQDAAAYEWTQGLFATAGFEFPAVIVEFRQDDAACGGVRGLTSFTAAQDAASVLICATHPNPQVEDGWRRRTLLHEVAHAWIDQNVDQTTTAAFMELRGTEVWAAWDHAWEDRGTEHAAETLMWGIQDGDYKIDFRLDNVDCDELSAGYEMLTGTTVSCEISPD